MLGVANLGLIAEIDRSEHVDVEYAVVAGELAQRPVSMTDVPSWDPVGAGPHSVAAQIAFCEPLVRGGAVFIGAVDGGETLGLA